MKKSKKLIVRRSSDFSGGGFGFTLRHFVIYPPSVSVNDILRASYSVVIDEHQQKQLDSGSGGGGGGTTSSIGPSTILSSSSASLIHHQGEQQRSSLSSSSSSAMKIIGNDNIQEDGTTLPNNPNPNPQSMDTIFVKEVRPDGPAYAAGLRQGDQILTVNDQAINGKSYSQVIAMIQNTPNDLVLNVIPKDDETLPVNSSENVYQNINSNDSRIKPIQYPRSSSYHPSTTLMANHTIEQKLRNLQTNLAQGRTQQELAQAGIFFPPSKSSLPPPPPPSVPTSSSQQQQQQQQPPPQQNIFSNYIDSVHRALDSSKQQPSQQTKGDPNNIYYQSPYHNDYIQYDYSRAQPTFQINFEQPNQQSNFLYNTNTTNTSLPMHNIIRPPVPPRQSIPVLNNFINVGSTRLPLSNVSSTEPWNSPNIYSKSIGNSLLNQPEEELKSPSTDSGTTEGATQVASNEKSPMNENDMKTEFVNFRKKQFETGHVENLVRDPQRESKTKKYSEKKKYETEWNRLTAIADVETVMERASHFEDIDPDKFARLKSKLPTSPPIHDKLNPEQNFIYEFNQLPFYDSQQQTHFKMLKPITRHSSIDSSSAFSIPRVGDLNSIEFNFDPRYMMTQVRANNQNQSSHYNQTTSNENTRYQLENYQNPSSSNRQSVNLIRQPSYINAVRPANQNEQQPDFVARFGNPTVTDQELKQRQTTYSMNNNNNNQRINPNQREYIPHNFNNQPIPRNENSYEILHEQEQKLRNASHQHHHHQTQAIKKLKSFFSENLSSSHLVNDVEPISPPSSSGGRSKSGSIFDGTLNNQEQIRLTTTTDNIEPSKEGILYCKTVLKEGRRAADRSWRGAWAVLRRGALFLGKEKKHGLLIPLSYDSFPINLQNAEVELASDYIKKPRVFKLITANQSEFLFQAPDSQSLNEWLDVLNEHCISSESQHDNQMIKDKKQRKSTASLPPIAPQHHELELSSQSTEPRKSKSKLSLRSPSLKRSPSLRFRKAQKSSITQPAQALPPTASVSGTTSPPHVQSPRRSFVKSIVKKGLRTLKSSSSLLTSQMSGQIYDESSAAESLSTSTPSGTIQQSINFGIELEECETSSISQYIPIVVEILTRLVELRGINYQGIYRNAGGLTAVNWLVNELDKGSEKIDFNSEKWYDVKAVASALKTFFAKLPDSLLSSKISSLAVEASRIENHCERLVELKKLVVQLDDYRFETLKYLCAHFRRVAAKCDINKIDARNLAIIFGPTLIWDSKASLQSNLVDNPEKIRIIEAFILYHEWFFDDNSFDSIPAEINPQMPRLPPIISHISGEPETVLNNETKPGEIIQHIVRAAKRRWSSPLLLDALSSLNSQSSSSQPLPPTTTNDQQTSKPLNISVKRDANEDKVVRSYSVDLLLNEKTNLRRTFESTDSALYSMSDNNSTFLKDFFYYFKSKFSINKNPSTLSLSFNKDEQTNIDSDEKTLQIKRKLFQRQLILENYQQQINDVDQQILSYKKSFQQNSSPYYYSSLYALELL